MVVVEGGPNTVKTVLKSIQNEIPCIFVDVIIYLIFIFELFQVFLTFCLSIQKSGRFSDILSYVYEKIINKGEAENELKSSKVVIEIEEEKEDASSNLTNETKKR